MKQVSQNYKTGSIRLEEVDTPALKPGGALVQTACSVISAGTEGMKVKEGKMSLLEKARARPDQVKKVVQSVQQQGLKATYQKVMNKLDSLTPLGYSTSGIINAVGSGVPDLTVGQRVACAGAGYANHAEVNFVPRNLIVPIPEGVSMEHAAFTTIGSIALQGFRQSGMQLGETACVIGLGLLGQILVQILKSAGVNVIGVDLAEDRCKLARALGASATGTPDDPSLKTAIKSLTSGAGADCIFICAGGSSNQPVEFAVEVARDRARVVDIGKTRLDLSWKDYYEKELDVRFSRSYGPGRYDPNYEERGIDYPIGYVRWTERRNMSAFLELVAKGAVNLGPIISGVFPFSEAEKVFADMAEGKASGLGVVLKYYAKSPEAKVRPQIQTAEVKSGPTKGAVRVGVIGAGNYASSMLLPHLVTDAEACLAAVATARSLTAADAARKFGFERSGTEYKDILNANDIDAVVVATRHASHASMTAEALRAGKAVFVEKPLAIDFAGAERIRKTIVDTGNDRLQVGFNRRFAPLVMKMKEELGLVKTPLVMTYRVHAGQMDSGSWYLDSAEGSRFLGEAGHFLDVLAYLTDARPISVFASFQQPGKISADDRENMVVTVDYDDGSVGSLLYLTQGATKVPKEYIEVFGGGRTLQLDNFEKLTVYSGTSKTIHKSGLDKGQKGEMAAFVKAVRTGGPMPAVVDCLLDTTLATLAADKSAAERRIVHLSEFWSIEEAQ
ncbi:MAG: bi-domain-containing oxidoreductase [Verrucomicrobia bacterium]|nr:bi-domain-containing oxidoreductase [Verrucomicrobiota bacterium]